VTHGILLLFYSKSSLLSELFEYDVASQPEPQNLVMLNILL